MDNLKGILVWSTSVNRVPIALATALQASGACWLLLITFKVSYPSIIVRATSEAGTAGICWKLTDLQVMQPVLLLGTLLRFRLSGFKAISDMICYRGEGKKSCKTRCRDLEHRISLEYQLLEIHCATVEKFSCKEVLFVITQLRGQDTDERDQK
jgi:hypothetical protein